MFPFKITPSLAAIGALSLLCVLLGGLASCQSSRLDDARLENARLRVDLDTAVTANESVMEAMEALRGAHTALIDTVRADKTAILAAAQRIDVTSADIRRRADQLRIAREELFNATPSCQALERLDIAELCPGLAGSLRQSSGRQGGFHRDSGNPGEDPPR